MKNTNQRGTGSATRKIVILGFGGALLVTGCSSSTSSPSNPAAGSSSSSPNASAAVCTQITSLRASLTSLTQQSVGLTSAGKIATDLKNVQTQLAALKGQATGPFASQANQLTAALDTIKKDAQTLLTHPSSSNMTALTGSIAALKTKAQPMISEMRAICPNS